MATIERTGTTRPDLGLDGGWWPTWFAPTHGWRTQVRDVVLVVVVAFVQIFGTIDYSRSEPSPWDFDVVACIPLTVGPVALLLRRRWPEATLLVTFLAAAAYAARGYPRGPAGYPAFGIALLGAILVGRRAFAWGALAVAFVAFILLPYVNPDEVEKERNLIEATVNLGWLPLVAAGAVFARVQVERRAEQADMQRVETRRRASEERLLIARELHDVLAHNISLINVQSGVALHLLDERPGQARPALQAINEASEAALGELRSVLDVLSRGVGGEGDGEERRWAPRSPTAGVGDLDGLVRRTRAAGLEIRLAVDGETRPVPSGVDLAAFRIVQEALTNVVRHAGEDVRATVRLVYAPTELVVQVDDDGRGAGSTTGSPSDDARKDDGVGRGITGMRERVHALGGMFNANPRHGRGFRVRARFPLHTGTQ
ncbi:MAG: sensor histidine kinase [Acidimicrobiales bacterium]